MHQLRSFKISQSLKVFTVVSFLGLQLANADLNITAAIRSNSEGAVSQKHIQDLNRYRQSFFYGSDGRIDLVKLEKLKLFLIQQKEQLLHSAKMNKKVNLITEHGYSQEDADEKGSEAQNEKAEALAPYIFALEHVDYLKNNLTTLSQAQIHEKVETTLLFLVGGYTIYPEGIFTSAVDRSKNLIRNFFNFKKNENDLTQASNLLNPATNAFLTDSEIAALQKKGEDISKLNPPSSAFWTNNDIESYDPMNEVYFGEHLFPPRQIEVPTLKYKRMGNGNIKIKTEWVDEQDLDKTGKPKKKDVTIRLGHEAYATPLSSHLARIVGYPANPNTFRKKIKLDLGKTSFEQFVTEWKRTHGLEQGSPLTHIERIANENAVYIKNANLEAYPDDDKYRKLGPFRMGDNGFGNRREYRAMVLLNALISLQDQFEYQSRIDAYRDNKRSLWQPIYFISDVGQSLGIPTWGNTGTANEYTWNFTRTDDDEVKLFWLSIFNSRTWDKTTYSDVKWLARRLARINAVQIDDITKASGLPEPVAAVYAEKIKSRIAKMIKDFNLDKEGFVGHQIKSTKELSQLYPKYVDEKGYLKEGTQQIDGNTIPVLGNSYTPSQAIKVNALNEFSNAVGKLITESILTEKITSSGLVEFDLGKVTSDSGKIYEASRKVSINSEVGADQRRYLVKDKLSVGLPIGIVSDNIETPASIFYVFTFDYVYSVDRISEVASRRFFQRINPFELNDIRENLKKGEQLNMTHSYGASLGRIKVKALDQLKVEAALLGIGQQTIKTAYFTKSDNLLEAYITHFQNKNVKTGLDVSAAVRVALMYQKNKSSVSRSYYKLDLLGKNVDQINESNRAFYTALVENDFSAVDRIAAPLTVVENNKTNILNLGLLLWNRDSSTSVSEISLNQKSILLAKRSVMHDRSFERIWNSKKSGVGVSLLNFFGNLTNEGEALDVAFEGSLNSAQTQFERLEVNLSFTKSDRYTKRNEFYSEFTNYFNNRSGESAYINFNVPEQIKQYQNLVGLMRWQLNAKAVVMLMQAIAKTENLQHITLTPQSQKHSQINNRELMARRAQSIVNILQNSSVQTKQQLFKAAKEIVNLIEGFIGPKGQHVALVRKHVKTDDIWIITSIEEMLDLTHPTFRLRNDFWAPEVGKFQGHSDLDVFRRTQLLSPIIKD